VNRLRTILSLLLALVWLPVTVHCLLESLPGIDFLSCCLHDDSKPEPATAHQDNDCETDACATVESGLYKQEDSPGAGLVNPLVTQADWDVKMGHEILANPLAASAPSTSPPELSAFWQFSLRTASQPRAPSSAV
jgi:hypothetical protein